MNAKQAKQINLAKFLAHLGYQPNKEQAHNLWYKSPFREESTPSFKVDSNSNCWYDFGLGKGGTIVDFVAELQNTTNISVILAFIEKHTGALEPFCISNEGESAQTLFSFHKQKELSRREIHISPQIGSMLFSYLKQRGITEQYMVQLQEASIFQNGKHYKALAFENDKNGYELNNKYYKGCTCKAISTIKTDCTKPISVFEAFIDCLSFWELSKKDNIEALDLLKSSNFLILNSVSLIEQGIEALKPYADIRLFLDNDDAGASASQEIKRAFPMAKDYSHLYKEYKDLNEFLVKADESSFVGFLSRCAIVRTEAHVSPSKGNLAFTPEGRKSSGAILSNLAPQGKPSVESKQVKPKNNRGLCK